MEHKPPSAKRKAEIERELEGEPTGFDILVETKESNIDYIEKLIDSGKVFNYQEEADKLGVTYRSILRYIKEIKKRRKGLTFETNVSVLIREKQERIKKLQKMIAQHPDWSHEQLSDKMGVSVKRIKEYVRLFPKVED